MKYKKLMLVMMLAFVLLLFAPNALAHDSRNKYNRYDYDNPRYHRFPSSHSYDGFTKYTTSYSRSYYKPDYSRRDYYKSYNRNAKYSRYYSKGRYYEYRYSSYGRFRGNDGIRNEKSVFIYVANSPGATVNVEVNRE